MSKLRLRALGLATATIALGLVWRLVPMGMPAGVVKYGGSALWGAMVYWLVAAAWPGLRVGWAGVVAWGIAATVEGFKLVRTPGLDEFRGTLAGKLLLGRYFSWWDLAVYGVAIAVVALGDAWWRRRGFFV